MSITVALLTYNRYGDYLKTAVEAVLSQSYTDFRLMILDNHSEDETADYILSLKDPRLTYVRQPPDMGPDINFSSAIHMCGTKYVLVTHDDDVMEPEMLEKYVECLDKHPNLLCVTSNVSLIDSADKIIQERLYNLEEDRFFRKGRYIEAFIDEILWLPTPTQLFRRDAMIKIMRMKAGNKFRNTTTPSGDILMNCQLNAIGPICLLKEPLLRYRQHDGQISRQIHQSKPLIYVIQKLVREAKYYDAIKTYVPSLHALYLRFYLQNVFFESKGRFRIDRYSSKLNRLKAYAEKNLAGGTHVSDAILPVEIIFRLFGLDALLAFERRSLDRSGSKTPAALGFKQWLRRLEEGRSIFSGVGGHHRIAIFGSMLLAYMLVLDAKKTGIDVVCCIDTSDARIGAEVFGVPVVSIAHVNLERDGIDLIVMSNERGNESAIRTIIKDRIGQVTIPVLSWKELCES